MSDRTKRIAGDVLWLFVEVLATAGVLLAFLPPWV